MAVFVLDLSGTPLMPCSAKRARLLFVRRRSRADGDGYSRLAAPSSTERQLHRLMELLHSKAGEQTTLTSPLWIPLPAAKAPAQRGGRSKRALLGAADKAEG